MQIVKHTDTNKVTVDSSTTIWEYNTKDNTIGGAVSQITGRYPQKGFVLNKISKELVFVISGNGFAVTPEERKEIDVGDVIFFDSNEEFAWEGNVTLFLTTSPKFDPKKHKILL